MSLFVNKVLYNYKNSYSDQVSSYEIGKHAGNDMGEVNFMNHSNNGAGGWLEVQTGGGFTIRINNSQILETINSPTEKEEMKNIDYRKYRVNWGIASLDKKIISTLILIRGSEGYKFLSYEDDYNQLLAVFQSTEFKIDLLEFNKKFSSGASLVEVIYPRKT